MATAQEKAQAELDIANRKIEKLTAKRDKAKADLDAAVKSLESETALRDHIASHPALQSVEEQVDPTPAEQPVKPQGDNGQTLGF
jgi:hypothetical protein